MCNMAVEMGAKAGLMQGDEKTRKWLGEHSKKNFGFVEPDKDAQCKKVLEYKVSRLVPQVTKPHTADNVIPVEEIEGIPIQQTFLGTCTNEDWRIKG